MSQNNPIIYVGLDVAKCTFVVHFQARCHELTNDAPGHARLVRLLTKAAEPIQVILEATGGYEQPIVRALHAADLAVSVVLPGRVRAYARALGRHAKTDPIDAAVLTAFGAATQPTAALPRPILEQDLAEVLSQRQQLVAQLTQLKNQAAHHEAASVQKRSRKLQRTFEKLIAECTREIAALQAKDPELQRRSQRLQEVDGVGPIVAAVLVADMPELGSLSRAEAAALAGVAPYNCDSGPWRGSRHISGGRASVRRALYMAALTASRKDGLLKTFYEGLIARGKKKLVALTAVMRKLIVLLNHLLKNPNFQLQQT